MIESSKLKLNLSFDGEKGPVLTSDNKVVITDSPYGFDVAEKGFTEYQLTIRFTMRQDCRTYVAVMLTSIDSTIETRSELVASDDLLTTIKRMCAEVSHRWIYPIEVIVE